ncbi:MAG: FMN-binding protein [bacterium]
MTNIKAKKFLGSFLLILVVVSLTGCLGEINNLEIKEVDLTQVRDGEYIGECNTTLVSAEVKVIVEDHKIINIDILKHKNGRGEKAEKIVDSVADKQSIQVDMVSGATGSSKVILKAIENALRNGI